MDKIGKFRGIPVYVLNSVRDWLNISEKDEVIYVFEGKVYYHREKIATLSGTDLTDFDETKFNELRAKGWYKDGADLLARTTGSAETRPQEKEKLDKRPGERDAANDIVEQFMNSWNKSIDDEIAVLKKAISAIEIEGYLNAVN